MQFRFMAALAIAVLCGATTGSSASADDETSRNQDAMTAKPTAPSPQGPRAVLKEVPLNGRTAEELLAELSKPMTPAEAAAAAAESERNSSTVHFYPDAPEDPRMEPPPLNEEGED
ncbi:hypothetical protein [Paractinoplanes durhamensis]|uniref:Secreted protein n=1 Tax=Paractinoplanes durhamensis TaxID=113563 RepID=A0ABQ3ZE89_9ACTN|nr:hypothetical protein [Actinoplanes durhamensis]GIE08142.1 hypothetical protein Adu01nite_94920 [Actinoplanes durhamensis]